MLTALIVGIVTSVIAGVATIVGSHMSNKQNKEINQQQQEHAEQAATTANLRNQQNYLAYESPQAMVAQLEKAGLSKGLMYSKGLGGQGVSQAPQATTPGAIPMQNMFSDLGSSMQQANQWRMEEAQIQNLKANTELQKKQAGKTEAETENINLQNNYYAREAEARIANIESQTEREKAQASYTRTLEIAEEWQTQFNIDNEETMSEQMKLTNEQLKENVELMKKQGEQIDQTIENLKSENKLLKIDARTRHQINVNTADNLYSQTMRNNYQSIYDGLRYMLDVEEFKVHKKEIEQAMQLTAEHIKQAEFITNKQEFTYHLDNCIKVTEGLENITSSYENIKTGKAAGSKDRGQRIHNVGQLALLIRFLRFGL